MEFIKALYCPKSLNPASLPYEAVRQITIKPPKKKTKETNTVTFTFADGQAELKHPKLWMPPESCLKRLATLYDAMMEYMRGLGDHTAVLPDFTKTCLVEKGGQIEYDLGPESHVKTLKELLAIDESVLHKQQLLAKGAKRHAFESTPIKPKRKRKDVTST